MAANRVENLENQKKKKKRRNGVSASGVGCFEELRFEEKRRRKKKKSKGSPLKKNKYIVRLTVHNGTGSQ